MSSQGRDQMVDQGYEPQTLNPSQVSAILTIASYKDSPPPPPQNK